MALLPFPLLSGSLYGIQPPLRESQMVEQLGRKTPTLCRFVAGRGGRGQL